MQTRKALAKLGHTIPTDSPLGEMADQLVTAWRAKEAARMDAAHARAENLSGGAGPHLAAAQRKAAEASRASLFNTEAPAVTRGDFHALLQEASRAMEGKDRGLKLASAHAYKLWTQNPEGSLSVGDIARLRDHYTREFPRSRVATVIERDLPRVGFNTLPLSKLSRIAAHISRQRDLQAAYEEAVERYGLDGQDAQSFRARAFVRSLVEGVAPELQPEGEDLATRIKARMATDADPLLSKYAQLFEEQLDDEPMEDEDEPGLGGEPDEAVEEPEEAELDSPITGEPLQIELSPGEDEDFEPASDGGDLPLEMMAQLDDFAADEGLPGADMLDAPESTIVMQDPTDPEGGELEVSVRPLEEAGPEPVPESLPDTGDAAEISEDMEMEAAADKDGEHHKCGDDCEEHKMAFSVYACVNGEVGAQPIDTFQAAGMAAALRRIAGFGVKGAIHSDPKTLHREAYVALDGGDYLHIVAELPEGNKDEAFNPDVNEQMDDTMKGVPEDGGDALMMNDMGKQKMVQAAIDGKVLKRAGWELLVNDDAEVELRYKGKRHKTASMFELEAMVDQFSKPVDTAPKPRGKYAAFGNGESMVVVTDVPAKTNRERQLTAAQILKAIQEVLPTARGVLRKDARLQIDLPAADDKVLGRVRRVLEDRYRVAEYKVAQMMADPQDAQMATGMQPQTPEQNEQQDLQLSDEDIQQFMQEMSTKLGRFRAYRREQAAMQKAAEEDSWPKHLDEGRFTEYCKREGFDGPCKECADKALESDDDSVRGMASFYLNTVKPGKKGALERFAKSPPGWEDTVKEMKDDSDIDNPFALAWWMKDRGYKPGGDAKKGQLLPEAADPMADADAVEMEVMSIESEPAATPMLSAPEPAAAQAMGQLSLEEQDALRAALTHYRNQGLGPMSALDQLSSQYSDLLDRFGEKTDMQRHMVEAESMKLAAEVWMQPALLDKAAQFDRAVSRIGYRLEMPDLQQRKQARRMIESMLSTFQVSERESGPRGRVIDIIGADDRARQQLQAKMERLGAEVFLNQRIARQERKADEFEPEVHTQQPDAVTPPADDLGPDSETEDSVTNSVEAPEVNEQVEMQSQPGTSDSVESNELGPDSEAKDPGSFGAPKPDAHPDAKPQPGESFASTEGPAHGLGKDSETNEALTKKEFDAPAAKAPDALRSAALDEWEEDVDED